MWLPFTDTIRGSDLWIRGCMEWFIYYLNDNNNWHLLQTTTFMSSSFKSNSTSTSSSPNVFSPSSSPPLILAFLAIGLFSAAMAFVFWRRIQGNTGWRLTATIPLNNNIDHALYFNLPLVNTDVPKLWDLSNGGNFARGSSQGETRKEGEAGVSDVLWVNLMPLSVYKVPVADDRSIEPRRQQYPLNNFLHTTIVSKLNPLSWRRNRRQSSSRRDHDDGGGGDDVGKSEDEMMIRVAVTIALPSPEYLLYRHVWVSMALNVIFLKSHNVSGCWVSRNQ